VRTGIAIGAMSRGMILTLRRKASFADRNDVIHDDARGVKARGLRFSRQPEALHICNSGIAPA
jgi:hypothetical protein